MSSGAQAQIAASQAASAASAEAAANALAFSKDIFGKQQQQRTPYIEGGQAGLGMLMNLLGLSAPGGSYVAGGGGAGGSGGGFRSGGTTSSSRRTGGTGGTGGVTGGTSTTSAPGSMNKPTVGGKEYERYPGGSSTFDEGAFRRYEQPLGGYSVPDRDFKESMPVDKFSTVTATDPEGNSQVIPSSLAPFYAARGWTV